MSELVSEKFNKRSFRKKGVPLPYRSFVIEVLR